MPSTFRFTTISNTATFALSKSVAAVDEGSQVTITLDTTGVQNGQAIPYTITGTGITADDFVAQPTLAGNFTVQNNNAIAILTANNDMVLEGPETFTVSAWDQTIGVNINDTSVPTYALGHSSTSVAEGSQVTITLDTTGVANGTVVPYTISGTGIVAGDFTTGLTGSFTVSGNTATVVLTTTADFTLEGNEVFNVALDNGLATSANITITDTSVPTYALSRSATNINEGGQVTITLDTQGVANGTTVPYTISGTGITAADFTTGLTGSFTVNSNVATLVLTTTSDVATEGGETFTVALNNGLASTSVVINDTSIAPTYPSTLWRTLDNPNAYSTSANDNFGYNVAISGNYAIVGAPGEKDAGAGGGTSSGKAYIFNVTTGALVWTLNNPNAYNTSIYDNFGNSVDISGNYAIVAAYYEDDASGTSSGKAYIFNVTTGALVWTLNNPNAYGVSGQDQFGTGVAISGNYAIVGAPGDGDAGGSYSGKAYIFNVTTGALVHTISNPNAYGTSVNDSFGIVVAISGNYAIVGATIEGDAGGSNSGKAYIFNVTTGALVWTLNNPNAYGTSGGDYFSKGVAISGNYAIVGASLEDDAGGSNSGKAYIFNVTTGALVWTLNNPNAYGTSDGDQFGSYVAISGNYAIVGAPYEAGVGVLQTGKAYIFDITSGALVHTISNPNAYGTALYDGFGNSVAISGNYAIVAAMQEDDASGTSSGKAYIFN